MEPICQFISYAEATKSPTAIKHGIDNTPDEVTLLRMKVAAKEVFMPLRMHFGKPIGVSSFYRSAALNKLIGGSSTSQHVDGEAMDLDADIYDNGITNKAIFEYLRYHVNFDQLIYEFGTDDEPAWVHVSYTSDRQNRSQMLRSYRVNGSTKYLPYP